MCYRTIVFGLSLALLSGCGIGSGTDAPLSQANLTSAAPVSALATTERLLPASMIVDPSHAPTIAWSTDAARRDASLRHVFVDYVSATRRQDIAAIRAKHLTAEAAAGLESCMSTHVDIDEAWASCTLSKDFQAYAEETGTSDETHGAITYRTIRQGENAPGEPRKIDAILTINGPRLLTFNLNNP